MLVDSEEQNWFKRAHIGQYLGIAHIITSSSKLSEEDRRSQTFLQAEGEICSMDPPREDARDHDIFISLTGALYVVVNSQKDNGKVLKKNILKDIVPRGFDTRIEEIQEKNRKAIEEKYAAIALLNNNLKNREYENIGLLGQVRGKDQQIAAFQRRYVGHLLGEDKNNCISIIVKNNEEEEYPYIYLYADNMVIEETKSGCC